MFTIIQYQVLFSLYTKQKAFWIFLHMMQQPKQHQNDGQANTRRPKPGGGIQMTASKTVLIPDRIPPDQPRTGRHYHHPNPGPGGVCVHVCVRVCVYVCVCGILQSTCNSLHDRFYNPSSLCGAKDTSLLHNPPPSLVWRERE